jgi:hypothetical protein
MSRAVKQSLLVAAACIGVTVWGLATNPPRPRPVASPPHRWASFAPGSWTLVHETLRSAGQTIESDERVEIVDRSPDHVEVRFETTTSGRPPKSSTLREGLRDEPTAIEAAERLGVETLTIEGRPMQCVKFRRIQGAIEFTFWLAPDVAWPVKSFQREVVEGVERERVDVVLTRFNDAVAVPGRSLQCAVFEEIFHTAGTVVRRASSWRTTEVAGHEARREESFALNGEPATVTRVIASFAVK